MFRVTQAGFCGLARTKSADRQSGEGLPLRLYVDEMIRLWAFSIGQLTLDLICYWKVLGPLRAQVSVGTRKGSAVRRFVENACLHPVRMMVGVFNTLRN